MEDKDIALLLNTLNRLIDGFNSFQKAHLDSDKTSFESSKKDILSHQEKINSLLKDY